MHQWEGRLGRVERFFGEPDHHRRVFADRVEHDRVVELGGDLADDVDALGFELLEVREIVRGHRAWVLAKGRNGKGKERRTPTVREREQGSHGTAQFRLLRQGEQLSFATNSPGEAALAARAPMAHDQERPVEWAKDPAAARRMPTQNR